MEPTMTATVRRVFSTVLLATLLGVAGSMLGMSAASAGNGGDSGSETPITGPGGGTITLPGHGARVCAKGFKPGSTVHVVNQTTGQSTTIHSNFKGRGCNQLPVKPACQATTQTIVETGTGANGKPATVTQTVTSPARSSLCVSSAGSTLPFTGSSIIISGTIIGLVLLGLGIAMTIVRRHRAEGSATG
jgi:hypothetical protein